jgi:hypothetical protein
MLTIIVGLITYILISRTNDIDEVYILATDKQVACLENLVMGKTFATDFVSGPSHFKKLKIFKIHSNESDDEVRINYSSCLTNRYAKVTGDSNNLSSLYMHFKSEGAKDIGIFKSQDSDIIHLYSFE